MRLLLLFVALAVIVMVAKRLWLQPRRHDRQQGKLSGRMVQCKHCGVYLPEQEAHRSGDNWYCSTEHSREDRQRD